MPARSRFCLRDIGFGTRMRTGTRCTILVKLPVALSGGSSVNTEPAAGDMLSTTPVNLAVAIGVDRDRHRLAGPDALELRFLEIGVDIDVVERHHIAEPLPGLDEVAGVDQAVGEDAVDRRAHRGEVEIALGLGQRGLQFRELRAGFGLLRLGDLDIVARGVVGRLRRPAPRRRPGRGRLRETSKVAREAKPLLLKRLLAIEIELARASGAASAEASCALACSTALSCAVTWRPMRSMVACWVAILVRAASTAMR